MQLLQTTILAAQHAYPIIRQRMIADGWECLFAAVIVLIVTALLIGITVWWIEDEEAQVGVGILTLAFIGLFLGLVICGIDYLKSPDFEALSRMNHYLTQAAAAQEMGQQIPPLGTGN